MTNLDQSADITPPDTTSPPVEAPAVNQDTTEAGNGEAANAETANAGANQPGDILVSDGEKFIPLTRFALMNRLTEDKRWHAGEADDAKRFFRYLAAWRHQTYNERLLRLKEAYMPFSPDRDTIQTQEYSKDQLKRFQKTFH